VLLSVLSNGHLGVGSYSTCDWFNSKAAWHLIHIETVTADFNLSGDTNVAGVQAWENDTKTRENHDKFYKCTKLLIENKHEL